MSSGGRGPHRNAGIVTPLWRLRIPAFGIGRCGDRAQTLPARGKPPVVLLYTDQPDTETIGRVILEGAAECLMKPLDRDLLEFKLKQVGLL